MPEHTSSTWLARVDAGLRGQDVDRLEAAEVVLVVILQHLLGQPVERDAVPLQVVQDLLLVDRMAVVEADNGVGSRLRVQAALLRLRMLLLMALVPYGNQPYIDVARRS